MFSTSIPVPEWLRTASYEEHMPDVQYYSELKQHCDEAIPTSGTVLV